eukprot:1195374-Prorocentrum_minimum.AAC.1
MTVSRCVDSINKVREPTTPPLGSGTCKGHSPGRPGCPHRGTLRVALANNRRRLVRRRGGCASLGSPLLPVTSSYVRSLAWPAAQVLVQGLSGLESIADLGPIQNLDPQRAFGIEREDILQADIASSAKRTDAAGQVYYEW